jgi:uncharacterized RDD family membrane protein YckC
MKKQIIYSTFINRIFASTIDVTIFSLLALPLMNFIGKLIFAYCFQAYFSKLNVDINNYNAVVQHFLTLYTSNGLGSTEWNLLSNYIFFSLINNLLILGLCYCGCWLKWGNTPGKALLKLKIIDEKTNETPTYQQFFRRYLGYIFAIFNIFIMPFDKRTRGVQDIIAGTIVIKD